MAGVLPGESATVTRVCTERPARLVRQNEKGAVTLWMDLASPSACEEEPAEQPDKAMKAIERMERRIMTAVV